MVFNNKQPFINHDNYQLSYNHPRPLYCGGQLASFAEFPSFRGIAEEPPISEGENIFSRSQGNLKFGSDADNVFSAITNEELEIKSAQLPNDSASSALGEASCSSWVARSTSEVVRLDHCKRPLSEDSCYQVELKRAKQEDLSSEIASTPEGPCLAVVDGEELHTQKDASFCEDPAKSASYSSIVSLPWFTCCTSEEDARPEPPGRLFFFPGYFEDDRRTREFNQPERTYSLVFDCPPRKPVAIGPNHQAYVPVCRTPTSLTCSPSASHLLVEEDNNDKLMGTLVMPMCDSDSLHLDVRLGKCKTECNCPDEGSIRCVRQHVYEAREKLKKALGQDKFTELGFCEIGENVAHRWTEVEEQIFYETVLTNPASLGKNFWDNLSQAFPSRSTKELVSYYFNVFVLRKRAEQNRSDPYNADSDNDEWQGSDEGEFAITEDDEEDSVVESPADRDDATCNNDGFAEVGIHEDAEDGDESDYNDDDEDDEDFYGESRIGDRTKFVPNEMTRDKSPQDDGGEDQDVEDDSCTSYEGQHTTFNPCGAALDFVECRNGGASGLSENQYIASECDPKTWEIGYNRGMEKIVDFLPTCSVIEEVFGKGTWDDEARGGRGV